MDFLKPPLKIANLNLDISLYQCYSDFGGHLGLWNLVDSWLYNPTVLVSVELL